MSRPKITAEIVLCGVVSVEKARGPGYVVGELQEYWSRTERARVTYHATPAEALRIASERAEALVRGVSSTHPALGLLGATTDVLGTFPGWVLADPGGWVRAQRLSRGWTQRQLALEAGLAPATVSSIERGRSRPSWRSLERLLLALSE